VSGRAGHLCVTATNVINIRAMLCSPYTYLPGFSWCVEAVGNHNMLDLLFANFTDRKPVPVKPDIYQPPLRTDISLSHVKNILNCDFGYRNFAAGNYTFYV
jgi:hypothetical protein